MFNIFQQRKNQLIDQENIDKTLKNLKKDCSHFVSEYLLIHREISRQQQHHIINSKFWKVYDETQKQLDENQKHINQFFTKINSCDSLKKYLDSR